VSQDSIPINDQIRREIVSILSVKYQPLMRAKRSHGGLYSTADQSIKVVIAVSRRYPAGNFWYSYNKYRDEFLASARCGLYVLGCVGRNEAFALPFDWITKKREVLNATTTAGSVFHHIRVCPDSAGDLSLYLNNGKREPLRQFAVSLSARSATAS
jgi:hypothetical protein